MALITTLFGKSGHQLEVDPTHLAARVAMRPLEHVKDGRILGQYAVAQRSGELVATIGALGHLASFRWALDDAYAVLLRIRVGWSISGAVTTAVEMNLRAIIARAFTVDFTTAATAINMATVIKTNAMRASMGSSLMGTVGPRIATTTVQSGQTLTADNAPIGMVVWPSRYPTNSTGTAVAQAVGDAGIMKTIYECTSPYQYPVVLSNNEGVLIQPVTAGPATGTFAIYTEWTWAEVEVF
mgnify:FL=1